jgi:hypothetical protein
MEDTTGFSFSCHINGVAATICENCIALHNCLHNLTMELKSANLIITFLEDTNTTNTQEGLNQRKQISQVI